MQILRSWLFVPGNQSKMIKKASTLDVDVLIYDLEDSVPLGEKETARQLVAAALQPAPGRSLHYVRVPAGDSGLGDYLRAVVRPGLDGLVVPKVQSPVDVQRLDASLAERELATGREVGSIRLLATIESGGDDRFTDSFDVPTDVGQSLPSARHHPQGPVDPEVCATDCRRG